MNVVVKICGAWVQIRQKADKVAIWTSDAQNRQRVLQIGSKFKDRIKLAPNSLYYQKHTDTANKTGSSKSGKSAKKQGFGKAVVRVLIVIFITRKDITVEAKEIS